jgi:hypothetical protein
MISIEIASPVLIVSSPAHHRNIIIPAWKGTTKAKAYHAYTPIKLGIVSANHAYM